MSDRIGRNRNKGRRKRRRVGLKVRWKDVFVYGPLALFLLVAGIGPFVFEFCYHRNVEYVLVLIFVIAIFVFVMWPKKNSR